MTVFSPKTRLSENIIALKVIRLNISFDFIIRTSQFKDDYGHALKVFGVQSWKIRELIFKISEIVCEFRF